MPSQVDDTVPPDNQRAEKAAFRANWRTIKNEITTLQEQTSLPWLIALGVVDQ